MKRTNSSEERLSNNEARIEITSAENLSEDLGQLSNSKADMVDSKVLQKALEQNKRL